MEMWLVFVGSGEQRRSAGVGGMTHISEPVCIVCV